MKNNYKEKLLEILKNNNIFSVVWNGHFCRYYVIMKNKKNSKKIESNIYTALYESFFNIEGDELYRFCFDYKQKKTWKDFYNITLSYLKKQALERESK